MLNAGLDLCGRSPIAEIPLNQHYITDSSPPPSGGGKYSPLDGYDRRAFIVR